MPTVKKRKRRDDAHLNPGGHQRILVDEPRASSKLNLYFGRTLKRLHTPSEGAVFVCIGSDRSTGDALGPLVGAELERAEGFQLPIYGTLDRPVHASNLEEELERIRTRHGSTTLVAIDSSLGSSSHVGSISIRQGPLKPGSGVAKDLPAVGDLHITGTVNISGFMEFQVLQSTRLHLVMQMVRVISTGLTSWARAEPARETVE